MREVIMRAEDICKSFANSGVQNHVLDRVNVEIYKGDFTIIMGSSGAGKSTLLYALSCMDGVTGGKVYYKDQVISGRKERQLAPIRAKEFGFVFQQTHLISNLTLFENVVVAGYLDRKTKTEDVHARAKELLTKMDIWEAKDRYPSQVSGGEAQRAAIARAMINAPGIVFADEPTGALNKRNTTQVLDILTKLNRDGQSIVMVTHDSRAAIRATRLLYLEDGKVIGEMSMLPYEEEQAKNREAQVGAWLASMQW